VNELALFAGIGGGILGSVLLGHTTVCAVEIVEYRRRVLLQRQIDGVLPRFPIWDDICTFDGKPWRGVVDVVSGGFPCQGISSAGRGAGLADPRSGLWSEMARVVREVGPRYVFVENSPMLTRRGLDRVLGDLASMGYDACWCTLGSGHVEGPCQGDRIWILASANGFNGHTRMGSALGITGEVGAKDRGEYQAGMGLLWKHSPPGTAGVDNGIPNRVERIAAIGDGQVPLVAAVAWTVLERQIRVLVGR
jgi:DNA (cytosine-5)-methyltransferase 1